MTHAAKHIRLTQTRRRFALTWLLDALVPKQPRRVTFVCKRRFGFSGNLRAVCLAFARRRDHEVYVWCEAELPERTRTVLERSGVTLLPRFSLGSVLLLVSSGIIVVDHSIRDAYISRKSRRRSIVNLWHGVPIKNIELGARRLTASQRRIVEQNAKLYDLMIASSEHDRRAIASAFGVPPSRVHVAGLPRYDLLDAKPPLEDDLVEQEHSLLTKLQGRKLVLYAPTFRESGPSPLSLIPEEGWRLLGDTLANHGAVLGVRTHPYDAATCPTEHPAILRFTAREYPETNLVLRHASVLITDFSSLWIDYLLLSRPIAGLAPDRERYRSEERGFIYDLDEVFPGPFFASAEPLAAWLATQLSQADAQQDYPLQRKLFHSTLMAPFSERCVELILNRVGAPAATSDQQPGFAPAVDAANNPRVEPKAP